MKSDTRVAWAWWIRRTRSPWFSTLANVLGVFAGLTGALYTEAIRNAVPFQWTNWNGFSWHALFFWCSFIVFAFTFLSRERSVDELRAESEKQLQDTIRTMPPRGLVMEFAQYFEQCHRAVRALESEASPTREQLRVGIRMLLSTIAQLARKYDAAQSATYAANIMLYFENASAWQKYSGVNTMPDIKFVEREAALDRLPLLVIDKALSASTTTIEKTDDPDPALARIPDVALPVPDQKKSEIAPEKKESKGRSDDGKRWRVLPGAPLTFFTNEPNTYEDTTALGQWCRERGDFSESVCLQVEQYFGQDAVREGVRSFASMPLVSAISRETIGVVNLHANRTGILSDPGAASQFFPLAKPFTTLLADLVLKLSKVPK